MSIIVWTFAALFQRRQSSAQELSKLPYVPTPQIVVDEMLKMANVTAKDFVIDLGSGDGRMIHHRGAKLSKPTVWESTSIAKLVDLSNRQAKADGVDDRAKFIEQDMFKADISKATVVTLYVLPDFMEKLRPKLLSELKPGTRIVAHDYYMSEWYPDRQFSLTVPEKVKPTAPIRPIFTYGSFPASCADDWRMEFDRRRQQPAIDRSGLRQAVSNNQRIRGKSYLGPMKIDKRYAPRRRDQLRSI